MSAYERELKGVVGCGSASSSVVSRDRGKSEERRARSICGPNREGIEGCWRSSGTSFSGGEWRMSDKRRARSARGWNVEGLEGCGISIVSHFSGRKRWRSKERRARIAFTEE